jgi:hypothetical protein
MCHLKKITSACPSQRMSLLPEKARPCSSLSEHAKKLVLSGMFLDVSLGREVHVLGNAAAQIQFLQPCKGENNGQYKHQNNSGQDFHAPGTGNQ